MAAAGDGGAAVEDEQRVQRRDLAERGEGGVAGAGGVVGEGGDEDLHGLERGRGRRGGGGERHGVGGDPRRGEEGREEAWRGGATAQRGSSPGWRDTMGGVEVTPSPSGCRRRGPRETDKEKRRD